MTIFDFLLIGTALGLLCGICVGILHEEKLVRFERAVWIGFWRTVKDWAADKLPEVRA